MLRAAIAAGALACSVPALAAGVTPMPGPAPALTVELRSDRQTYTLGEAVTLSVRVANETSSPILVRRFSDTSTGSVWPRIARGGGEFLRYVGPDFGIKHGHYPETALAPGEEFVVPVRVLYNAITEDEAGLPYFYAFDAPGRYQIRADVVEVLPSQRLTTNTIRIEMRAPTGTDATVWNLLQKEDVARFLHHGASLASARQANALEQILQRFPESLYAANLEASLSVHRNLSARKGGSAAGSTAAIVEAGGRTFVATTPTPLSGAATEDTSRAIADLVSGWVGAWNSRDMPQLMRYLSRDNSLRQRWDQGETDADHEAVVRQIENAFLSMGTLSIDIVGTNIGEPQSTADLMVRSGQAGSRTAARTMEFLREGGSWRISEVGF